MDQRSFVAAVATRQRGRSGIVNPLRVVRTTARALRCVRANTLQIGGRSLSASGLLSLSTVSASRGGS